MEIFNVNRYAVGLTPKINLGTNNRNVYFGLSQPADEFQINSPVKYFNESFITDSINSNPEIKQILSKYNIPVKLNMPELIDLKENHCRETAEIAAAIAKNMPPAYKQRLNVSLQDLKDAAILHDFGKVLIPPEILNKSGKLTDSEHEIMNLHSELGYQLLKNSGVNDRVLNLIRNHHANTDNQGKFVPDINLQILNLADKYSALTEKRVYKEDFSPQKALMIIYNEVKRGEIDPMLFNSLVKTVNSSALQPNVNKC